MRIPKVEKHCAKSVDFHCPRKATGFSVLFTTHHLARLSSLIVLQLWTKHLLKKV